RGWTCRASVPLRGSWCWSVHGCVDAASRRRAQQRVDQLDRSGGHRDVGVVLGARTGDQVDEARRRDETLVLALAGRDLDVLATAVVPAEGDAFPLDVQHEDALGAEQADVDLVLVAVGERGCTR